MATETLRCAVNNHPWQRQAKPGRKPTHCPNHLWVKLGLPEPPKGLQPPPAPPEQKTEEKQSKVGLAPDPKPLKHKSDLKAQAEAALTSSRIGEETKRKISYCYDRLERGSGTQYLETTYKALLREAKRRL